MSDGLEESRERDISFTGEPPSGFSADSVLENKVPPVKPLSRRDISCFSPKTKKSAKTLTNCAFRR